MKTAIAVILSGCAILGAAPAFADRISLSKGVKLCKAQMDQRMPALKSYAVDFDDSMGTDTHFRIEFNATNAEGRLDKFTCTVDRKAKQAVVAPKPRRTGSYPAPEFAGRQRIAVND